MVIIKGQSALFIYALSNNDISTYVNVEKDAGYQDTAFFVISTEHTKSKKNIGISFVLHLHFLFQTFFKECKTVVDRFR
jgi:hypothetical protein